MGVIQTQSTRQSIVKLLSVVVGFVSMLFIYPLNHEVYGFAQFIYSFAALLVPLIGLGVSQCVIKFHPIAIQNKNEGSFLPDMLLMQFFTIAVLSLLFYILKEPMYGLMANMDMDVSLLRRYDGYILMLSVLLIFCGLISNYISNYGLIVIPTAMVDLGYKIFLPTMVLLIHFSFFYKKQLPPSMLIFYAIVLLTLLAYGYRKKTFKSLLPKSYLKTIDLKEFTRYSIYSALGSIGAILAFRIDAIMITSLMDEESTGLYFNIFVIAMIIDIPNQAIGRVAGPVISKKWQNRELSEIYDIYRKAALNAFIGSQLLFIGILTNLDALLSLSSKPEVFVNATVIFAILGAAKVIDSITGINSHIIVYSKEYKYNLLFLGVLGVLNIVFNFTFIPKYGIIGAALATLTSLTIYNLSKFVFILLKFKMMPFDINFLKVLGVGAGILLLIIVLPMFENTIIAIIVRSSIILILYVLGVYYSKSSLDFNNLVNKYLSKVNLK